MPTAKCSSCGSDAIRYHCDICDCPYYTELEARECEAKGQKPFLFESIFLRPKEGFKGCLFTLVIITCKRRHWPSHENIYDIPLFAASVEESYLEENFESISSEDIIRAVNSLPMG
ncbi:hypothetical protein ACFL11_00750 [Patescibacteria group bacterium]